MVLDIDLSTADLWESRVSTGSEAGRCKQEPDEDADTDGVLVGDMTVGDLTRLVEANADQIGKLAAELADTPDGYDPADRGEVLCLTALQDSNLIRLQNSLYLRLTN